MAFDSAGAQHQLGGDAAIAVAPAEESENPSLSGGDRRQGGMEHGADDADGSTVPTRGQPEVSWVDGVSRGA